MTTAILLAQFDHLTDAHDAVPRFRRFILDLAVRGKLVDQDADDESASELVLQIQEKRQLLIEAGELRAQPTRHGAIRKQKELPLIEDQELPFGIPDNWVWVRFAQIASFSAGRTPPRHDFRFWDSGEFPWVSIADMVDGGVVVITKEMISDEAKAEVFKSDPVREGTIIMSFKLTIGKISRLGIPAFHNEAIISISPYLSDLDAYLFKVLPQFSQGGDKKDAVKGATLNRESISNILLPLPPVAEQHRIAAKIDELMALCDELEAAHAERESRRQRLTAASTHRLSEPEDDGSALREQAGFHLSHLSRMTARPDQISTLRQTILNLAVQGKLVEQDPNDGSSAELIEEIDRERSAIAETDRRTTPKAQDILSEVSSWEIPLTWTWRGLADLALFIDYRGKTPAKTKSGVPLITAKNVRRGFINPEPREFVSKATYDSWMTRGLPRCGDVLLTTEAPMGNVAVVHIEESFALAQRVINFRLYGNLDSDFVAIQLLSPPFQAILAETATGLTAKGIKGARLKRLPFALPPLTEQRRIAQKVDELMALCDELEEQMTMAQSERSRLLEAVLQEALFSVG